MNGVEQSHILLPVSSREDFKTLKLTNKASYQDALGQNGEGSTEPTKTPSEADTLWKDARQSKKNTTRTKGQS